MRPKIKKDRGEIPKPFSFEAMRFQWVEVRSQGILYRGVLIGADSDEIFLKGVLRWIILPLEKVTSVRLQGQLESFNQRKMVDAAFYGEDAGGG